MDNDAQYNKIPDEHSFMEIVYILYIYPDNDFTAFARYLDIEAVVFS